MQRASSLEKAVTGEGRRKQMKRMTSRKMDGLNSDGAWLEESKDLV